MAIKTMSYLELTPEQRRFGAKAMKDRLRASLANASLTPEQQKQVSAQIAHLDKWERGLIELATPAKPAK